MSTFSSSKVVAISSTTRSQTGSTSTPSKGYSSSSSYSQSRASTISPTPSPQVITDKKPTIAILGTGWAGWTLAQDLGSSKSLCETHQILVLSPSRTMALTPLLASAACGIFDFRIAEEPVRRLSNQITKYQVTVSSIDFENKTITCRPNIGSNGNEKKASDEGTRNGGSDEDFVVSYDRLVLAPGSETNTFGTPGVMEHCYTMKSVQDATKLRERILDCLELASLPTLSAQQKKDILHFVIIGAGPTGVELAAEIDELLSEHLLKIYPDVASYGRVSVYDIQDKILGMFGQKLSEYAMEKFRRRDVNVCMERHIESVSAGSMRVKEDGDVRFGIAVWATGNKACKLVEDLEARKTEEGMERIVTDRMVSRSYAHQIGAER